MGWLGGKGIDPSFGFKNQFSQMTQVVVNSGKLIEYSLLT